MADSKVSELVSATSLGVSDLLYVVQSNTSKKITAATLFANAANTTLKGTVTLDPTVQSIVSAGDVVDVSTTVTHLTSDASGGSITIPAGSTNQIKIITMITTAGGAYTLSSNVANSATITFNGVGKSATLLFTNNKWHMIGGTASIA
jgi:monoamine oxidase